MTRLIPGRESVLAEPAQLGALSVALATTVLCPPGPGSRQPGPAGPTPARNPVHRATTLLTSVEPPGPPGSARPLAAPATPPDEPLAALPADLALDEERPADLWREYLATGDRLRRDRLVVHYTPLVRGVAHRVGAGLPTYVDLADLVQAGVFGLIEAIERFDPVRCVRFESYATLRVRGAMLDELRAQDWIPRTVRGRVRELERVQEQLEARLGRAVTDRELAAELGVGVRELRGMVQQVQLVSVEALDENAGGRATVAETLADDAGIDPDSVMQRRETSRQLTSAVAQLGERDQLVVHLYYVENRTLAEIGRVLGVTESRVCQLHARLVVRLRGRLEELAAG